MTLLRREAIASAYVRLDGQNQRRNPAPAAADASRAFVAGKCGVAGPPIPVAGRAAAHFEWRRTLPDRGAVDWTSLPWRTIRSRGSCSGSANRVSRRRAETSRSLREYGTSNRTGRVARTRDDARPSTGAVG